MISNVCPYCGSISAETIEKKDKIINLEKILAVNNLNFYEHVLN